MLAEGAAKNEREIHLLLEQCLMTMVPNMFSQMEVVFE